MEMGGFAMIGSLLHLVVTYMAVALVVVLILRMFTPPRNQFGSQSPVTKLNRLTDPIVNPIHSMLPPGTQSSVAAILAIFLVILAAWFLLAIIDDLLFGVFGFIGGLMSGAPVAALGALLYGIVSLFTTLVIVRIVFSWLRIGYYGAGAVTRFVYNTTEPVMAVFRGLIPSIAGLDLSPILLFFLLSFVKNAIRGLLM